MKFQKHLAATCLFLQCILSRSVGAEPTNLPIVLWHGMGASAGQVGGTSLIKKFLQDKLDVYVLSISTGTDAEEVYSGFFGHINNQVDSACKVIAATEELKGGYNALGLSQGVINIPVCTGLPGRSSWSPVYWACRGMQKALELGAYVPWVQHHVIQAQYYRDPDDVNAYLSKNTFLPAINNEGSEKSEAYRDNIAGLSKLVLIRFASDFTVVPKDSAWFSLVMDSQLVPLNETTLYKEDFIGLRELQENGRLVLDELPGAHMHFSLSELEEHVIDPYFRADKHHSVSII